MHLHCIFPFSFTCRHKVRPVAERKSLSEGLPFKCKETALCRISMLAHLLAAISVTPSATITCHPCTSSTTLPPFLSPDPCASPVILSLLPLCCGFPSIQVHTVHTSGVFARRPAPAAPLGLGGLRWWQVRWMIDKSRSSSSMLLWKTKAHLGGMPTNQHGALGSMWKNQVLMCCLCFNVQTLF